MKTITPLLIALGLIVISFNTAYSQGHVKKKLNYKKHPYWIEMMDDPNVNYLEAIQAFEEFWEERGEPEKEERSGEHEKRSLLKRLFKSDEKLEAENRQYFIQFKRFNQWKRDVEPFVQSDGSILSKEEQLKIWENSRK